MLLETMRNALATLSFPLLLVQALAVATRDIIAPLGNVANSVNVRTMWIVSIPKTNMLSSNALGPIRAHPERAVLYVPTLFALRINPRSTCARLHVPILVTHATKHLFSAWMIDAVVATPLRWMLQVRKCVLWPNVPVV
jgi:hypothetical protein